MLNAIILGCMGENVVKCTCGGTSFEFNIRKDEKKFSKSDGTKSFLFKIWQDVKFLTENPTRRKDFEKNLKFVEKNFVSKSVLKENFIF